MDNLASLYIDSVIKRFQSYKEMGDKTFLQLEDDAFCFIPNENSNSIAQIIQHLSGNMLSRWTNFLTEDGEKEWRQRDDEFETHTYSRARLLQLWDEGWNCLFSALRMLKEDDLVKTVYIHSEGMPAVDAINRQLAHYASHVGQIIYIGKLVLDDRWKTLSIPKKKPA